MSKTTPLGAPVSDPLPRLTRCRMLDSHGERCTGEALDPDPKVIRICSVCAGKVILLVAEARARRLGLRRSA